MDLRIFVEPQQGATYDTLLTLAKASETLGYSAFFRSDHYVKMGSVSGLPGPTDAWITLAGLARETSTIRLGTLVNAATFRYPGPLAISVAQVDAMSNGRVELGLGAGWFQSEHDAYGIPFPDLGTRFEMLEEQLAIVSGLWAEPIESTPGFSYHGKHYMVKDSPGLPKPQQKALGNVGVPIVIGGGGPKRTPRLAATYASEFNVPFSSMEKVAAQFERVRNACIAIDRDPVSLVYSTAQIIVCGRTETEIAKRAASVGREVGELRENGLCGTPDEVAQKIRDWEAMGVQRCYLQILDLDDLDHVELIANKVRPLLV
jgi:F420-dependent oxidoreductase-like protein